VLSGSEKHAPVHLKGNEMTAKENKINGRDSITHAIITVIDRYIYYIFHNLIDI
jgi:hypothetical protein